MFRALLTYPLILAVAVGPLLCCCTAGRVLGSVVPTPANTPRPEAPVPSPRASAPSCCAHKHQNDRKPAAPKPSPSKPGQPCPCKDGANKVQATQTAAPAVDWAEHLRVTSLDLVTPEFGAGSLSRLTSLDLGAAYGPPLPFPSGSDLLYAHHRLRC
jgi:hypothetical protein